MGNTLWTNISNELYRTYYFPGKESLRIENPLSLHEIGKIHVVMYQGGNKRLVTADSWLYFDSEFKVEEKKPTAEVELLDWDVEDR